MLFNYILSSLTNSDPCLIESNCTNLVRDKPLLKNKKTKLVYGYFSLISLIKTIIYFYQFFRFFQNILHFRAFHCSHWKTRFSSLLLGGNILISIFKNAMNQSLQGTKATKAHDAVPGFCEHPLKILNARTIKFGYNKGQLVSVPKGQCMDRVLKEYKRDTSPMVSRPTYANECLITSLSAKLVLNLLSRIHYTTQSATLSK